MSSPLAQTFSPTEATAVISMGVIAGCVSALQPLLLGSLQEEQRLTVVQIGQAATAEALGMTVAATLAAMLLKPTRLQPVALAALLLALVANAATTMASGLGIILLRGLNGLCSGLLLWILLGLMARTAAPGRTFAIYVTAQAAISFLFSLLISHWLVVAAGAKGGYLLFAAVDLVLVLAVMVMPGAYTLGQSEATRARPPMQGLLALIAVGLFIAAIMAFWVYVLPLGTELGYPPTAVNSAISMAIGAQIVAGICAVIWAAKLRPFIACLWGTVGIIGAIAAFWTFREVAVLYVSLCLFSFIWMFVPPFQMPLLIELDPSLRSAIFIGTAQLGGVALGPMISAQLLAAESTAMAATVGIALALLSIGFLLAGRWLGQRVQIVTV